MSIGPQDFAILNCFVWNYVTDRVYADNPLTLHLLKTNIGDAIVEQLPEMCQKVIEN